MGQLRSAASAFRKNSRASRPLRVGIALIAVAIIVLLFALVTEYYTMFRRVRGREGSECQLFREDLAVLGEHKYRYRLISVLFIGIDI